jgi:hypothetical protein
MKSSAACVMTLLLAGCANVPTVAYVDNTGTMDRGEFMTWLNDGTTLVSVTGSPFPGVSDDALAKMLASEMPTGFTHSGRYTADPQQASGTQYRLVWNFGGGSMGSYSASCAAPLTSDANVPPDNVQPTKVTAELAFCRSNGPLMRAYGFVSNMAGPETANFHSFVTQMTLDVLVFEPPSSKGGGGGSN